MRFTNTENLEKMLLAMKYGVIPELKDTPNTRMATAVIILGLEELLKRELITQPILQELIPAGMALAGKQLRLLENQQVSDLDLLVSAHEELQKNHIDWNNVAGLNKKFNDLITLIDRCSLLLFKSKTPASGEQARQISALLKQTAEWELAFHERQNRPLPEKELDEAIMPVLKVEALESFIAKVHKKGGQPKVSNVERVLGGFGKETWLFDLNTRDGLEQLVLRRSNSAPGLLDRGTWQIRQEFPMVQLLYKEGVLVPEPLWMGRNEPGFNKDFYLCRRVGGKPMGTFMKGNDDLSESLWLQVAEQLARIHSIPIEKFTDHILEFYDPELVGCTASQGMKNYLDWWYSYWKDLNRISSPIEVYLFDWLYDHLPDNTAPASVIHSDFGVHNMLADEGRLTAILDWESLLFGSPAMDLAYVKKWVTETMNWQVFVDHYVACGGAEVAESEYAFCDTLTYTRTLTATNQSSANLRFYNTTEYKEIVLGLQFWPEMMKRAFENTTKANER